MTINDSSLPNNLRFPAEWERIGAVLVAWPHADTDWAYMLDRVNECYLQLCEVLTRFTTVIIVTPDPGKLIPLIVTSDIDPTRVQWFRTATNDTWIRDYGPLVTTSGPDDWYINDFKFNGWGLKFAADKDNLVTGTMCRDSALMGHYKNMLGFVLEGGSIETDGNGTLLTTSKCLLSPNRNGNMSADDIEKVLCRQFGAKRVLWLHHGALEGDDTDSHIDTLARFAPDNTIVYTGTRNTDDSHFDELRNMRDELRALRTLEGEPYRLLELPLPSPIYDEDGNRLPATYANFLVVNKAVLMPTYNQPDNDRQAAEILAQAFPGYEIVTVDCNALIQQHGSLHCATMQLPYEILPLCPTPYELV